MLPRLGIFILTGRSAVSRPGGAPGRLLLSTRAPQRCPLLLPALQRPPEGQTGLLRPCAGRWPGEVWQSGRQVRTRASGRNRAEEGAAQVLSRLRSQQRQPPQMLLRVFQFCVANGLACRPEVMAKVEAALQQRAAQFSSEEIREVLGFYANVPGPLSPNTRPLLAALEQALLGCGEDVVLPSDLVYLVTFFRTDQIGAYHRPSRQLLAHLAELLPAYLDELFQDQVYYLLRSLPLIPGLLLDPQLVAALVRLACSDVSRFEPVEIGYLLTLLDRAFTPSSSSGEPPHPLLKALWPAILSSPLFLPSRYRLEQLATLVTSMVKYDPAADPQVLRWLERALISADQRLLRTCRRPDFVAFFTALPRFALWTPSRALLDLLTARMASMQFGMAHICRLLLSFVHLSGFYRPSPAVFRSLADNLLDQIANCPKDPRINDVSLILDYIEYSLQLSLAVDPLVITHLLSVLEHAVLDLRPHLTLKLGRVLSNQPPLQQSHPRLVVLFNRALKHSSQLFDPSQLQALSHFPFAALPKPC
ncbi:MAG: hypothetical protein Q8P67_07340 [archaeon]|nr:hypothetical protein [archaeon]